MMRLNNIHCAGTKGIYLKWILLLTWIFPVELSFAQSQDYIDARNQANADRITLNATYDASRNVYISQGETIHIFLFEDGNLLLAGFPTTATEKSKYQVHLYTKSDADKYLLEYSGSFTPVLGIQGPGTDGFRRGADTTKVARLDFAILGPFTSSLILTLKKMSAGSGAYTTITTTTIKIAKTIHASIGAALLYTSLKNPSNIHKSALPDGQETLVADDVNGRGMLGIMATFYPWGRNNLLMPSWGFKDRFGIVAGTSVGAGNSNFSNALVGVQYDFSIGGSFLVGLHYGRRQRISGVNYKDFKFGETVFTGDIDEKKYSSWDPGIFFGIQIDSRIFSQIFPGK